MTDSGREKFEHSYDDLALMAIRFMSAKVDSSMVEGFAKYRSLDLERRAQSAVAGKSDRVSALAKFLSNDGYAASVHKQGIGQELCQHHCPIAHVASEFPQMCEAETEAFARVLGTHVQRLATIADGDGVCTTFVPNPHRLNDKKSKETTKNATRKARTR
jgi:predicted ArsR family transcriptional regulator